MSQEIDYSLLKINGQPFFEFLEQGLLAIGFAQASPQNLYQTTTEISYGFDKEVGWTTNNFISVSNGKKFYWTIVSFKDKKFYFERPYEDSQIIDAEMFLRLAKQLAVRWSKLRCGGQNSLAVIH